MAESGAGTIEVALAEFAAARSEIDRKSSTRVSLISLNVTAVAAVGGFVLSNQSDPRLLLVLPILCSALGLAVLGEGRDKVIIASYVEDVLRPIIIQHTGEDRLFGWEPYYRKRYERGYQIRAVAMALLFPGVATSALGITVAGLTSAGDWIAWLLGAGLVLVLVVAGWPSWLRIIARSLAIWRPSPRVASKPIATRSKRNAVTEATETLSSGTDGAV